MTTVRTFRGLRYNLEKVDLTKVIVPPYDVISPAERASFYDLDPYNAIRLELTREVADEFTTDYSEIERTLAKWQSEGVLRRDEGRGLYVMKQRFKGPDGKWLERIGFYAELQLAEYEEREVLPHETTLSGPKADRLKLLRAAKANLSSVFLLYEDPENELGPQLEAAFGSEGKLLGTAKDQAGVQYLLAHLEDSPLTERIANFLSERACVIADGHHRYETALQYRRERETGVATGEGSAPFDSTLAFFANAYAEGSLLLPIHRVIKNRPAPGQAEWFRSLPGWDCKVEAVTGDANQVAAAAVKHLARLKDQPAFVADSGDGKLQIMTRQVPLGEELMVRVIEREVMTRIFDLTSDDIRGGEVLFPKSAEEAARQVRQGEGTVVLYLNALLPEDVFRVTRKGEVMPQKSTLFYPKIPTGMVFRLHEEKP